MPTDHFEFERWKSIQADSGHWYKAVELLGVGGNAATFLAHCTTSPFKGTLYAIKVFRKLSNPERRVSFLNESQFLQGCVHPAVLRVHDTGVYYENPFFVSEYLPMTMRDLLQTEVTFVEKVSLAMDLLSALTYLDALEPPVAHRDIKPENILVKGMSAVLGDFGLLKRLDGVYEADRDVFKQSAGAGMPRGYRTPDLVAYLNGEEHLTTKTDVFQLGLVLAELFTGSNPCRACGDISEPVRLDRIGRIGDELGGSVMGLLVRMLEQNPEARPSASGIIDGWEGLFKASVDREIERRGRAFALH